MIAIRRMYQGCLAMLTAGALLGHALPAAAQDTIPLQVISTYEIGTNAISSISGDGRYIVYRYQFPNPYLGALGNIYMFDRVSQTTQQVDITPSGVPSPPKSGIPVISRNGRYVLFYSAAPEMGLAGTYPAGLFVRDLQAGTTTPVVTSNWNAATYPFLNVQGWAGISSDGRYVVYRVQGNGGNTPSRLYVRDMVAQTTTLTEAPGAEFMGMEDKLSISTDGRYIAYAGYSPGKVLDLFVHDRQTGVTELVNVNDAGQRAASSRLPVMSDDGRFVAFQSTGRNLASPPESVDNYDIFVRDRAAGTTERVSVPSPGAQHSQQPAISGDGRYITYHGYAGPNGKIGVWVYDRLARAARGGLPSNSSNTAVYYPVVSDDGRWVSIARYRSGPPTKDLLLLDFGVPPAVMESTNGLSLVEGGLAATYTLQLSRAPLADVTVPLTFDAQQLGASVNQLVFTPANWNVPQTVSVQALDDHIAEVQHTSSIVHGTVTTDPFFKVARTGTVVAGIRDAVAPVVQVPGTPGQPLQSADVTLNGSAAPGATVLLTLTESASGNVQAVSVVANGEGLWLYTFLGLANGGYAVSAEADAIQGNTVAFSVYVQRDQQ